MRQITITRFKTDDQGTFSNLTTDSGLHLKYLELPWRDNQKDISCIPEGEYVIKLSWSPKHEMDLYHFQNVPNRTECEIHGANLAGDTLQGYIAQLLGCGAPGMDIALFPANTVRDQEKPQLGVTQSQHALELLMEDLKGEDAIVKIGNAY